MKDLTFKGTISGVQVNVTYRVDAIGDAENLTVSQVRMGDSFSASDNPSQKSIESQFKRLPYTMSDFKAFAEENDLELSIAESDGSNRQVLVEEPEE